MGKLISRRKDINWISEGQWGEHNPNFSGGQYVDDKGYLRVLRPKHPYTNKGYVYMHRLVMEEHLKRYLQTWESVHHINEIKLDNRLENLFLTTVPEHSAIHREGRKLSKKHKEILRETAKRTHARNPNSSTGKFVSEADS